MSDDKGFNWDVVQELLGWDAESMQKLKAELQRVKVEEEER